MQASWKALQEGLREIRTVSSQSGRFTLTRKWMAPFVDERTPERRATTKAQSPAGKSGGGASAAAAPASGTSLRQQISMRIRNSPAAKLVSKAATPVSTSGLRRGSFTTYPGQSL